MLSALMPSSPSSASVCRSAASSFFACFWAAARSLAASAESSGCFCISVATAARSLGSESTRSNSVRTAVSRTPTRW